MSAEADGQDNPLPTACVIVERGQGRVVLVKHPDSAASWALPNGAVHYGESAEDAARRTVMNDTGVSVLLTELLGVYSQPGRSPGVHCLTATYIGRSRDPLIAGGKAVDVGEFSLDSLPDLTLDDGRTLRDYAHFKDTGARPRPTPDGEPTIS